MAEVASSLDRGTSSSLGTSPSCTATENQSTHTPTASHSPSHSLSHSHSHSTSPAANHTAAQMSPANHKPPLSTNQNSSLLTNQNSSLLTNHNASSSGYHSGTKHNSELTLSPPYFNKLNESVNFTSMELQALLEELYKEMREEKMDDIRFASYRAACKLRHVQQRTKLNLVDLWNVIEACRERGLQGQGPRVPCERVHSLLLTVYSQLNKRLPSSSQLDTARVALGAYAWLLSVLDSEGSGLVSVFGLKVALSTLCSGKLVDKLRYVFTQISDPEGHLVASRFDDYLRCLLALPRAVGEGPAFGYTEQVVKQFFCEDSAANAVTVNEFLERLLCESGPPCLTWLPILHRMHAVQNVLHPISCSSCGSSSFTGFRYRCCRCREYHMCQRCFWAGVVARNHSNEHQVKEYTSYKSPAKQLGHSLRKSLRCVPHKEDNNLPRFPATPEKTISLANIVPASPQPMHNGFLSVGSLDRSSMDGSYLYYDSKRTHSLDRHCLQTSASRDLSRDLSHGPYSDLDPTMSPPPPLSAPPPPGSLHRSLHTPFRSGASRTLYVRGSASLPPTPVLARHPGGYASLLHTPHLPRHPSGGPALSRAYSAASDLEHEAIAGRSAQLVAMAVSGATHDEHALITLGAARLGSSSGSLATGCHGAVKGGCHGEALSRRHGDASNGNDDTRGNDVSKRCYVDAAAGCYGSAAGRYGEEHAQITYEAARLASGVAALMRYNGADDEEGGPFQQNGGVRNKESAISLQQPDASMEGVESAQQSGVRVTRQNDIASGGNGDNSQPPREDKQRREVGTEVLLYNQANITHTDKTYMGKGTYDGVDNITCKPAKNGLETRDVNGFEPASSSSSQQVTFSTFGHVRAEAERGLELQCGAGQSASFRGSVGGSSDCR